MFLKRLFYASASILMLAAAYHLGASTAGAQGGGTVSGIATVMPPAPGYAGQLLVLTANGDVYARNLAQGTAPMPAGPAAFLGNFWSGGTSPAATESWGSLKAKYR
jgi:hypothetical protein